MYPLQYSMHQEDKKGKERKGKESIVDCYDWQSPPTSSLQSVPD